MRTEVREKMEDHWVHKVTVPPGEYILGDPCYVIPDDRWIELLESCAYFERPIGKIDGYEVLSFRTLMGDGVFQLSRLRKVIGVDAGMIGLVPTCIPWLDEFPDDLSAKVSFNAPTVCERHDNGILIFGKYRISTDPFRD